MKKITLLAAFVTIVFTLIGPVKVRAADPAGSESKSPEAIASVYVVDLVATAAFGVAMNDAGDVTGSSYPDPGCGSSCLPPLEPVVWKGGGRIVLPNLPGFSGVTTSDINNLGWISGFGGLLGFGHAAAWKPNGSTYTPIDMGLLPGTTSSNAIGIDDSNRAVGYASTSSGGPADQSRPRSRKCTRSGPDRLRRTRSGRCGSLTISISAAPAFRPTSRPGRPR